MSCTQEAIRIKSMKEELVIRDRSIRFMKGWNPPVKGFKTEYFIAKHAMNIPQAFDFLFVLTKWSMFSSRVSSSFEFFFFGLLFKKDEMIFF